MVDQSFSIEGHFHPHRQDYIAGHAYMPNFMLLATAWGPKHGGINAFNMDFAIGLSSYLGSKGKIFCAAFSPPEEDVVNARQSGVHLVRVDRPDDSPVYD